MCPSVPPVPRRCVGVVVHALVLAVAVFSAGIPVFGALCRAVLRLAGPA